MHRVMDLIIKVGEDMGKLPDGGWTHVVDMYTIEVALSMCQRIFLSRVLQDDAAASESMDEDDFVSEECDEYTSSLSSPSCNCKEHCCRLFPVRGDDMEDEKVYNNNRQRMASSSSSEKFRLSGARVSSKPRCICYRKEYSRWVLWVFLPWLCAVD